MEQYKIDLIRRFLEEKYGVSMDKPTRRRRHMGRRIKGKRAPYKNSEAIGCLPVENRMNPQLPYPQLTEEDISRGLMNLLERGLIPHNCDLTTVISTYPSPVTTHPMKYHHPLEKRSTKGKIFTTEFGSNLYNVKYDLVSEIQKKYSREKSRSSGRQKKVNVVTVGDGSLPRRRKKRRGKRNESTLPHDFQSRKYNEMMDTYAHHHIIIRRGKVIYDTEEFISYQRKYKLEWGSIVSLLKELEYIMKKHNIRLAFVDGKKLFELSEVCMEQPTQEQLLECLVNYDEVFPLVMVKEVKFDGEEGENRAALIIQKTWRMYAARKKYKVLQVKERNAKKIQQQWLLRKRFFETRDKINRRLKEKETKWNRKMDLFKDEWSILKQKKLLIVHIPSLSHSSIDKRKTIPQFRVRQNCQIGRIIMDLMIPNSEIIYISPFTFQENEEALDYVVNIMVAQGFSERRIRNRITILTPEHAEVFPRYISLTRLLLYSPRTMQLLQSRCSGREVFIVPGSCSKEDHRVAVKLGLPIFGPHPIKTEGLDTKGGCKKVFQLADVNVPNGNFEPLNSKTDLILQLCNNIIEYPSYRRWVIKINNERDGRGLAVLDVSKLYCLAKSEREKLYRELKSKRLDHELLDHLRDRLYFELREKFTDIIQIVSTHVYSSVRRFLEAVEKFGAITESYPNRIVGSPVVNICIEPHGVVRIHSVQEKVTYRGFFTSCYLFPQKMVPSEALEGATRSVAEILYKKGVMGYVSVEYVAFLNSRKQLRLWGIDLVFRLTDHALYHNIFRVVTQSGNPNMLYYYEDEVNQEEEDPLVEIVDDDDNNSEEDNNNNNNNPKKKEESEEEFHYLFTGVMRHPSFSLWRHGNFFSRLKKRGLLYHLEDQKGIVFQIPHNIVKGCIGLLCIGQEMKEVVRLLHEFFTFVQEQNDEDIYNSLIYLTRQSNLAKVVGGLRYLLSQIQ